MIKLFVDGDNVQPECLYGLMIERPEMKEADISIAASYCNQFHWYYLIKYYNFECKIEISPPHIKNSADFYLAGQMYNLLHDANKENIEKVCLMTNDKVLSNALECFTHFDYHTFLIRTDNSSQCIEKFDVTEGHQVVYSKWRPYRPSISDDEAIEILLHCFDVWARHYDGKPFKYITVAKLIRVTEKFGVTRDQIRDVLEDYFDFYHVDGYSHVVKKDTVT